MNILKSKLMAFNPYQIDTSELIIQINIHNVENERVILLKIIDKNLKSYTEMLRNEISKYTAILNKLKSYSYIHIMRQLYPSMVGSIANYRLLTE